MAATVDYQHKTYRFNAPTQSNILVILEQHTVFLTTDLFYNNGIISEESNSKSYNQSIEVVDEEK